jgi:molybdopterin/thiamine biosynthesis adenylyltransferase
MTTTLQAPPQMWQSIRTDLLSTPDLERAAVGFVGIARHDGETRLLLRDWSPLLPDDYLVQLGYHLEVSPLVWARAAKRVRNTGEGLVVMHSHPRGKASFSSSDDAGERELVPKIHARARVPVAAVVVAPTTEAGRVWNDSDKASPLAVHPVGEAQDTRAEATAERFDRQVRALTRAGQAKLRALRIGVVGSGGLGSHVVQQLLHLGVGEVVVIDHDRVAASNLSRLIGSRRTDAWLHRRKTIAARRLARALGSPTMVTAIDGDVTDGKIGRRLLDCDVVIGCTDNHWSRAVLNQIAYQYYVPVLDLGVELQPGGAMGGRVTWLGPGSACLWCTRILDAERVRIEQLPPAIARTEQARGYIVGIDEPAPAVVSINGVVASLAVTELLARVTTFAGTAPRPTLLLYRISEGVVRRSSAEPAPDCPTCGPTQLGAGDLATSPWI